MSIADERNIWKLLTGSKNTRRTHALCVVRGFAAALFVVKACRPAALAASVAATAGWQRSRMSRSSAVFVRIAARSASSARGLKIYRGGGIRRAALSVRHGLCAESNTCAMLASLGKCIWHMASPMRSVYRVLPSCAARRRAAACAAQRANSTRHAPHASAAIITL